MTTLPDILSTIAESIGALPAGSWRFDECNGCWELSCGPPGRYVRHSIVLRFWGDRSWRLEWPAISYGPGVPGITAERDPERAAEMVVEALALYAPERTTTKEKP